ncbi:valine--tRNA ligase [uncultured Tateyamaria sp.]|uniref:valine--tRNA ligase n=1 Tax=uncultured Tateyamaria sp. TaxID=455651 RepID=UPI0026384B90|nr:valine--tRNA ligase [uncultured Tateyamaria sp.]
MALGKFNAKEAEARIYADWEKAGCFNAGANARTDAATYCVMIPPPNVTGVLHMGHAFNNTLQDVLVRWHRMRGFDTLWQPGTDHAGIATQMVVERRLAEQQQPSRTELGREAFTQKIWEWKAESGGTIVSQLKRLGASCDWSREAFTMSGAPGAPAGNEGNFHDAVIKVFVEMYNKGLIYRGKRLVNWDPHFETAISDLEVENIEVPGHMWHFKYPLAGGETYTYVEKDADGNVTLTEERDYISIATTRPETMLGDGAVAVHPSDDRYAPIIGKLCEIPVGPKEHRRLIPIITDEYPDPDFGSGAVKITGAHDFNDYQVAKRGGIPMYNLMDTKANMRADGKPYADEAAVAQAIANGEQEFDEAMIAAMNLVPDEYRGLTREEARAQVVAAITAEGNAVMIPNPDYDAEAEADPDRRVGNLPTIPMVENKPIMQPFGDRSKVVIEPLLTDQWFVDTDKIVGPALDAVRNGDVKILPESGEKVYYHWLENIEPWCISRQLWWGHQIPVWYGPSVITKGVRQDSVAHLHESDAAIERLRTSHFDASTPVAFCASNADEAMALAWEYYGPLGYEWQDGLQRSTEKFNVLIASSKENATQDLETNFGAMEVELWQDPDVLDTWFSSGLWPIGTLGWPEDTDELAKYFPTSDLITGQDILFFWVARMMMMQLAVTDTIPFDTVYLHGLVRDAKGKKMSKSTGNVVDPLDLIDEYGADALRFASAAMASLGGTLKLDTQRIAGYRNFGTKLWNAASYGEMRGTFDVPHSDTVPAGTAHPLNRWIIGELAKTRETVDQALTDYRFNDAASALYAFTWNTFCDWYLEFTKPIFDEGTAEEIEETKATYAWALDQCLILLHPIMPFITEELWGQKARPKKLIHADWPTYSTDLVDPDADTELNWVIKLIEAIRSARAQMHVPAGAYVPCVVKGFEPQARAAYERNKALIHRFARLESVSDVDDFPKGTVALAITGGTFGLPLADVIDVAEEIARLEKTLGKLAKELGGLRGRLKNPKFAQSAPPEVVEETKANLALREDEEAKLNEALSRLKEL